MPAPNTTVLIVGCGIAGPVLAVLLKQKGYSPIVFERLREPKDAGASIMLMPNGMKVLGQIGVAQRILDVSQELKYINEKRASGSQLALSTFPSTCKEKYGYPMAGILRTTLLHLLDEFLKENDIQLRTGWELTNIEEKDDSVKAFFANGKSMEGAFLIGTDGIRSATRNIILANKGIATGPPTFTGLVQAAGVSEIPQSLHNMPRLNNWYGEAKHALAYPITKTHMSWAMTLPELGPCNCPNGQVCQRLIKYGIYDREELKADGWYSDRVLLVGDAAHPTSIHLGQGANQALEDAYHLSHILPDISHTSSIAEELASSKLTPIFQAFAETRQPRTAALVKGARAQGDKRVVRGGPEACKQRDEEIAIMYSDDKAVAVNYDRIFSEPHII